MSLIKPLTYDRLRWEFTTKQIIKLADFMKIDISSINKKKKRKLADYVWKEMKH